VPQTFIIFKERLDSMARKMSNPRVPSWPQQCFPLSTVFDLIKVGQMKRGMDFLGPSSP